MITSYLETIPGQHRTTFGQGRPTYALLVGARNRSPPRNRSVDLLGLKRRTESRCDDACAPLRRQGQQGLRGLVPVVQGEVEGSPVNRKQCPAAEHRQRRQGALGAELVRSPHGMVVTKFK